MDKKVVLLAALLATGQAGAQERVGDWQVLDADYGSIASTRNDSGAEFGKICFRESGDCIWMFTAQTQCADAGETPALLSTAAGAIFVTLHCFEQDGIKYNALSPYNLVSDAVKSPGRVGIAIPLTDGLFKVVRFSLTGSNGASLRAEALAQKPSQSTKDVSL